MAGQGLGDQYVMHLLSEAERYEYAEIEIHQDTVEVFYLGQCQAAMNRHLFRRWLEDHSRPHVIENIMWTKVHGGTLALIIRNSGFWLIEPHLLAELRARV